MIQFKAAARSIRAFLRSAATSLLSHSSTAKIENAPQYPMNKVIWICWLQGWNNAPWIVRKCLASWQLHNPDWDIRALDASSLQRYIELPELEGKEITPASMSDIIRTLLLHEYGGVWCDATLLCHRPLDTWLPKALNAGFFAFDRPAPDRVLASWFIATTEGHPLIERLHAAVLQFWKEHDRAGAYFWFHYLFGNLCESDQQFGCLWDKVPKISADEAHRPQWTGLLEDKESAVEQTLLSLGPVTKLTYRVDDTMLSEKTLLSRLLSDLPEPDLVQQDKHIQPVSRPLASLRVSTQNLGDHVQILASQRLVERISEPPTLFIDRDDEIHSCPGLDSARGPYPLVLNGWFKTNRTEWPPGPALDPIFIGFHIRLFQCPELVSQEALDYYRKHSPIGCRDSYTLDLLRSHGIESFHSNCLSLSFPRRTSTPEQQEVFVVSRDQEILSILPPALSNASYVCHYASGRDFEENMKAAAALLDTYRTRARLIVTTMLHCALPAIAMGIPVVMFYPKNNETGHASDRERFTSLATLVPIHRFEDAKEVDWDPKPVNIGAEKLRLVDSFYKLTERWQLPSINRFPKLAPTSVLPPPAYNETEDPNIRFASRSERFDSLATASCLTDQPLRN